MSVKAAQRKVSWLDPETQGLVVDSYLKKQLDIVEGVSLLEGPTRVSP